jgi:hypothetical protein
VRENDYAKCNPRDERSEVVIGLEQQVKWFHGFR